MSRYTAVNGGVFVLRSDIVKIQRNVPRSDASALFSVALSSGESFHANRIVTSTEFLDLLPIAVQKPKVAVHTRHLAVQVSNCDQKAGDIRNTLAVYPDSVLELSYRLEHNSQAKVSFFSGGSKESVDLALGMSSSGQTIYSADVDRKLMCNNTTWKSGDGIWVVNEPSACSIAGFDGLVGVVKGLFDELCEDNAVFFPKPVNKEEED